MNTLNVKKGDTVIVLSGKDRGKKGKVLSTHPAAGKVVVEGVNFATKHVKPRKQGDPSGIMKQETPIRACKVMRVCPRVKHQILASGEKVRVCTKCGETI